jgi:hypothetical protein
VNGDAAEIGGLSVDVARTAPIPLLRLVTFIGRPRRFDLDLDVGVWAEALRYETLRTGPGQRYERQVALAAGLTFDLWHSRDLASFARLRAAGGYEEPNGRDDGDWTVTPAVEAELTLDRDGFHHLRLAAWSDAVLPSGAGPDAASGLPLRRWRHQARAEYELVVASINDQPLSLVIAARGQKRDDVPGWPTGWLGEATAQLRFSLWAPPRRGAPLQDRL